MRSRCIAVVFVLNCLVVLPPAMAEDDSSLYSRHQDGVVTLVPAEMSFRIPDSWRNWYESNKNNLHFSRKELDKVKVGGGEWDSEFSRVVNAILPFDKCAFHGGGDGWGRQSFAFSDLQMRAYVGEWDLPRLRELAKSAGLKEAKRITSEAAFADAKEGQWQVDSLSYPLWYGDYGSTAMIDLYSQKEKGMTAVLVFMYTSYPGEQKKQIKEVIGSFAFGGKDPRNQKGQQQGRGDADNPRTSPWSLCVN